MKKYIYFCLSALFLCSFSYAKEDNSWGSVYKQIKEVYIEDVDVAKIAVSALKGINLIDKNLQLADDKTRITLYYKGKVEAVAAKPKDVNDYQEWGKVTDKIIETAERVSENFSDRSFEVDDKMAQSLLSILDKDSEFYASMDDVRGKMGGYKRFFAARMKDNGDLYVKINTFNKQTYNDLKKSIDDYPNAKRLVLDVRKCPGGMVGEAIKIADLFLENGIIASTSEKRADYFVYYNADEEKIFGAKDIEIWTDEETASAAEILAGALQEQGRAIVRGRKTFGKGTLQKLILLPSGSVLAVTSGYLQTPSGREININGIIPNIIEESDDWDIIN
jgi:hypothetical protein